MTELNKGIIKKIVSKNPTFFISLILSIIGWAIHPIMGEFLMATRTHKIIWFGVGATLLIWTIVGILIYNETKIGEIDNKSEQNHDGLKMNSGESNEEKSFLIFENKKYFDLWHNEASFRTGLPKYPRNLVTNEINENILINKYANWKKHPNPEDTRIRCGFDNKLPNDLLDKNAELKYHFFKASYSEAEEMGFISDNIKIISEEMFDFIAPKVSEISEYDNLEKIITPRKWSITPEYNFEFVVILFRRKEARNKYIFDLGSINNKSRISIYLDREDNLCFRVIDENSISRLLRIKHDVFDKKIRLNLKFAKHTEKSYMEVYINGEPVAMQLFNFKIPFYYYDNNTLFIGANLDGTYCAKIRVFVSKVFVVKEEKLVELLNFDFRNEEAMFISDEDIIVYYDKGNEINFNRR